MMLVITGGHHTCAFAVIEELKKIDKELIIYWIGHKYSMKGDLNESAEYREVIAKGYEFFDIKAGKFYGNYSIEAFIRIFLGFVRAFFLLKKLKPHGIIAFGGYITPPVVWASFLLGIPSVTHEQTTVAGFANRAVWPFVKKIFLTWPASDSYFPKNKCVVSGLPIRKAIFDSQGTTTLFENNLPLVYITGGKQGSHILNANVEPILVNLLKNFNVVHQCGISSLYNDFENLKKVKETLPDDIRSRYLVFDYIDEKQMGEFLKKAELVVSRSGANIIYEMLLFKKKAVLVPLPGRSHNEQEENARFFCDYSTCRIILQKELTPQLLEASIWEVFSSVPLGVNGQIELRRDAAYVIAKEAIKIFKKFTS
ncbi:MAG: glycosyltransferase [Patescibacteria group bacterium]|mgnify:CR=1 FL=1